MSNNGNFTKDPHGFASAHTLYPHADAATNQAHMVDLALNDGTQFTEVRGDNKVAYCKIKRSSEVSPLPSDGGPAVSYTDDRDLWVMRVTYRSSSSAMPCYYLPWQANYMMRIKLKPSVHHPATTGLRHRVVEPDLFVTAALQGCTIMVSGDPSQPVVYHLNANNVQGPGGETLTRGFNNPQERAVADAHFDIAAQAKIQHMTQLHAAGRVDVRKEGPKLAGAHPDPIAAGYASRGAHLTDYMPAMKPGRNEAMLDLYWRRVQNIARPRRDGTREISATQFGTVFGVRKNGNWTFYRQTRTRIGFRLQGSDAYTYQWIDPVCVRFWP